MMTVVSWKVWNYRTTSGGWLNVQRFETCCEFFFDDCDVMSNTWRFFIVCEESEYNEVWIDTTPAYICTQPFCFHQRIVKTPAQNIFSKSGTADIDMQT